MLELRDGEDDLKMPGLLPACHRRLLRTPRLGAQQDRGHLRPLTSAVHSRSLPLRSIHSRITPGCAAACQSSVYHGGLLAERSRAIRHLYLLAPTLAAATASPHLEALRHKGAEVLLLGDAVDNWGVSATAGSTNSSWRLVHRRHRASGAYTADPDATWREPPSDREGKIKFCPQSNLTITYIFTTIG